MSLARMVNFDNVASEISAIDLAALADAAIGEVRPPIAPQRLVPVILQGRGIAKLIKPAVVLDPSGTLAGTTYRRALSRATKQAGRPRRGHGLRAQTDSSGVRP